MSARTFEMYVVAWLEHSRENNRPVPGPLSAELSINSAFLRMGGIGPVIGLFGSDLDVSHDPFVAKLFPLTLRH